MLNNILNLFGFVFLVSALEPSFIYLFIISAQTQHIFDKTHDFIIHIIHTEIAFKSFTIMQ